MKLSELFRNAQTSRTDENGESAAASQKNLNNAKLNRVIRSLAPGQTLQGEVVGKKGSEVQIKLADDMVLSARLEREMAIDIGKILTFEVRNNGRSLTLSPLFANTAGDVNVMKALEMASLPINESSVEMVQNMMERGMSIDKNSIQTVYRDVTANMDGAVRDIVQLHQLGIEVSPESFGQLKQYQSMEHQLTGAMNQILEDFSVQIGQSTENGNPTEALTLLTKLQSVFSGQEGALAGAQTGANAELLVSELLSGERTDGQSLILETESSGSLQAENAARNMTEAGGHPAQQIVEGILAKSGDMQTGNGQTLLTELLSAEELQALTAALKQSESGPENADGKLQNLLQKLTDGTAALKDLQEAVNPENFARLLKEKMAESWLLKPEMVQDKENLDKVYRRIGRQLNEMQQVLREMPGMEQSNLMKSVTNMQNNLDFMNQLNQAFTYAQIPLQMNGKETHGELYVYTNKKNLASKDGNVSAFLHLDMDNLGPVDVYVAMQNSKVNTKFYLCDDEMIDFISQHIHILNERLEKRGYSMNCEMVKKEGEDKEAPVLKHIEETENSVAVLGQYSFDVRA